MSTTVRHEGLNTALQQWLNELLPELARDPRAYRRSIDEFYVRHELSNAITGAAALPSSNALVALARTIPFFWSTIDPNPDVPADEASRVTIEVLARFALNYLAEHQGPQTETTIFDRIYLELEQYLFEFDAISYQATVEFWGLEVEQLPLAVGPQSTFRAPTTQELKEGSNSIIAGPPPPTLTGVKPSPGVLLEIVGAAGDFARPDHAKAPVDGWVAPLEVDLRSGRILSGLRLLRSGTLYLGALRMKWSNPFLRSHIADLATGRFQPLSFDAPPVDYVLPVADQTELQTLTDFLGGGSELRKNLQLPIGRFQSAFSRQSEVDRFIDFWIAVEALFSPEQGSEITFRMCTALAQFIGVDPADKLVVFNAAQDGYNARSKVLHGRKFPDDVDLPTHLPVVEEHLRRALRRCASESIKPKNKTLLLELIGT
ncbi:MAG: HEPN domain-containing protein [Thermomicrobiales bacterium]